MKRTVFAILFAAFLGLAGNAYAASFQVNSGVLAKPSADLQAAYAGNSASGAVAAGNEFKAITNSQLVTSYDSKQAYHCALQYQHDAEEFARDLSRSDYKDAVAVEYHLEKDASCLNT